MLKTIDFLVIIADNVIRGRPLEKHTHKNALYADEVGSVMGCGEHGGLQR